MTMPESSVMDQQTNDRQRLMLPELLAPAGSLEKLKFAIHYGADAVYIGGQHYGLRSNADNFSFDEMEQGVAFAKQYGARVFVATNIYAHNEDLDGITDYLKQLERVGISAIIAADPAIFTIAQQVAPKLEVHLSTQQSTMNWMTVEFWKEQGIPRVVLAREVSMNDIKEIKQHVDIEIEAFIHGAMCSSISGRCVLSNHFTDRDSNRGGCSQSCRWKYDLYDQDNHKLHPVDLEEQQFTMGSKDLGMIEYIPELVDSGIDSFKIEGRMKSIHYVATVVHAYRQAMDRYQLNPTEYVIEPAWTTEIQKAANRPLTTGFYYSTPDHDDHIYTPEDRLLEVEFAGIVLGYEADNGIAIIEQRNYFKVGQIIEFFGPEGVKFQQKITEMTNEQDEPLTIAKHPLQIIRLKVDREVRVMDIMRKWI
jgi:putative protease